MKLPSAYEPAKYEPEIYGKWEKSGVFVADPHSSKPHFSLSMPPPNETGTLHVGHALFLTLQDIIARYERQKGKDVLWLPGTDHAAIATNAIIEKRLTEQGTDKHQIGREAFIEQVKEFVAGSRDTITSQIRAMGASCDWSRARYTLDPALNRCVNDTFVRMYNDGLIYRGHRIINWDPNLETTISDDEIIYQEEKAPLYTFQYGPFQISTARPETKFGDKYVVVHPDDERYKQYSHGDTFEAEWINGPVKATVIKDEVIDPEFGTGAMTITPWHDYTDFEIAERHALEKEQIIDFNGRLLPIAGEFTGQTITEARPKIVEKLRAKGLLVDINEDYTHNIALNSRGSGVIEPQIKLQWFVDVNRPVVEWKGQLRSLKEVMRAVIEDGDITIIPKRFEKIYFHWIDNLRDWCISRQIWWGHRIPVWYRGEGEKPETYVGMTPPEGEGWQQDPDTLDTWFSSALWTWSTLADPELAQDYSLPLKEVLERSIDFKTYHPTDIMETGWDILFFWVARMVLATTYVMTSIGEPPEKSIPFKKVYLHGLVRTEEGKKMSKSDPDSIIDPMGVIQEYGTDALRLALIAGTSAGQDSRLGKSKIVANRNFSNKLWNVARFIEDKVGESPALAEPQPETIADHWILNRLESLSRLMNKYLEDSRFSEAYQSLYHFVWDELADWYVEANKVRTSPSVLAFTLDSTLKLAHPFAPFVTETIWQELGWHPNTLLAAEQWPEIPGSDNQAAMEFNKLIEVVTEARRIIKALGANKPTLYHQNSSLIRDNTELVKQLSGVGEVKESSAESIEGVRLTGVEDTIWLDINRATAQEYVGKLKQQQIEKQQAIERLQTRLANQDYISKAPEELIIQTKQQLEDEKNLLVNLEQELRAFEST